MKKFPLADRYEEAVSPPTLNAPIQGKAISVKENSNEGQEGETYSERISRSNALPQRKKGAADAIEFYKKVFGAKEVMRMPGPQGTVGHAEIEIDKCRIMLADEYPDMNFRSPRAFGGTSVHIHLYVKNADDVADRAVAAGAKMLRAVQDQFYGDRSGSVEDPFGHVWHVATHTKDVSMSELKKRAAAMACAAEKS